ncbi:dynamin family GTPase [Bacillaceae bacterium Marseille-Q3522]|nr:dynamin family GTPase [Bacillaceae bacterium Marseille-Q3522]
MVKIKGEKTALLRGQIAALYEIFQQQGNMLSADRARDLAVKLAKKEYIIAFFGNFSAGKSSMINQLIGENLLPSSPIPTSANVVKIKSGENYLKIFLKMERPQLYRNHCDIEKVKSLCKDGQQIKALEISYAKTSLPRGVTIIDTPGMDSTDDEHRIAAESVLHLADLVIYVSDYHHVQSESNFHFLKELQKTEKDFYVVINQIDKHREEEVSFAYFQNSVRRSFAAWGLAPVNIFYTSLKDPDHRHNSFYLLKKSLTEKITSRTDIVSQSIFQSLKKLGEEHLVFLAEKHESEIKARKKLLAELPQEERKRLKAVITGLEAEQKMWSSYSEEKTEQLRQAVDKLLQNAYLMPFQTRELARQYVVACQADFKIGFLFSKQKTEQERQIRLTNFYHDFSEKVASQLDWHIKDILLKTLKADQVEDPALLMNIHNFQVPFSQDLLESIVKTSASLTGEYVLQYTNDVAEAIKKIAKRELEPLQNAYLLLLHNKAEQQLTCLKEKQARLHNYYQAEKELAAFEKGHTVERMKIETYLTGNFSAEDFLEKAEYLAGSTETDAVEVIEEHPQTTAEKQLKFSNNHETGGDLKQIRDHKQLIEALQFVSSKIKNVPGFANMAADLKSRAEALQNRSYTAALFGGFSAGKSSFANALLGEQLLPVSPNPTTAAINKIKPVDVLHPHGTVLVHLKTEDVLLEELNRLLSFFKKTAASLEDAVSYARKIFESRKHHADCTFLHAFIRGFPGFRSRLGETLRVTMDQLSSYAANEVQSCFVEALEIYVDCALTRKGITLVDTPGAGSIHARHTGVAFDYIKNADAIIFVTYYNHAFAKADRDFLVQLGRVKDVFTLDKMFFLVNAIDLAADEAESDAVLSYVEEQLVQFGIRQPRLYPVSSMRALAEKLSGRKEDIPRMKRFEDNFYSFIENELMEITVSTAVSEWERIIKQLQGFIRSAEADQEAKTKKRSELKEEKEIVLALLNKLPDILLQQRTEQEISELVFYIKQRVFYCFGDFIRESFHPGMLKKDNGNNKKALQLALDTFLQSFGFELAQELRATSLRAETFLGRLLQETEQKIHTILHKYNEQLSFRPFAMPKLEILEFEPAFAGIDRSLFSKALSYFRNPKAFFEKQERQLLSDELEENMQTPVGAYLAKQKQRMLVYYCKILESVVAQLLSHLREQAEEYYQGALAAVANEISLGELRVLEKQISSIPLIMKKS